MGLASASAMLIQTIAKISTGMVVAIPAVRNPVQRSAKMRIISFRSEKYWLTQPNVGVAQNVVTGEVGVDNAVA